MILYYSIKLLKLLVNLIRDRVVLVAFIIRKSNSMRNSKRLQYDASTYLECISNSNLNYLKAMKIQL